MTINFKIKNPQIINHYCNLAFIYNIYSDILIIILHYHNLQKH